MIVKTCGNFICFDFQYDMQGVFGDFPMALSGSGFTPVLEPRQSDFGSAARRQGSE